ncbi:MAG: glutamine-hydrolyzing carbamoyl-phosphate synthase small subunit [Sulfolobales archaeon]
MSINERIIKNKVKCGKYKSILILEDGTVIEGCGFGHPGISYGELVFTTGMVGYPESLTDPSFKGQILIFTHPMMGNYGVPSKEVLEFGIPKYFESERIQVEAVIVAYNNLPSHWASIMSLDEWLYSEGIPGMSLVDTRALVKKIREKGVMSACLAVYENDIDVDELMSNFSKSLIYDQRILVDSVMPKNIIFHEPPTYSEHTNTLMVVDCGIKFGILRELLRNGFRVIRIPCYDNPIKYFEAYGASGIVYSNGPGNPKLLNKVIEYAKDVLEYNIPVLGICLGHQLLALAAGGDTYKLKYGHRGHNKPCVDLEKGKCFVTSQNHGYAVDEKSLNNTGFKLWMINADDKTVEGLKHVNKPIITVQFHPEGSPGPLDSVWVFSLFRRLVERYGTTN